MTSSSTFWIADFIRSNCYNRLKQIQVLPSRLRTRRLSKRARCTLESKTADKAVAPYASGITLLCCATLINPRALRKGSNMLKQMDFVSIASGNISDCSCNARHHTSLHDACLEVSAVKTTHMSRHPAKSQTAVLLVTARVRVIDRHGNQHTARALIDQGSPAFSRSPVLLAPAFSKLSR